MSDPIHFTSLKIPDLKKYLQNRGISCSFERKIELVRLCELASELKLEIIETFDNGDYDVMDVKRRTVTHNDEKIVISPPSTVGTWNKNLSTMPNIESCDMLIYFMTLCKWEHHRLQSYKNDNGFRLFMSGHIDNVHVSERLQENFFYIKSTCVPETRQSAVPYDVWLLVNRSGQVLSGGCTCVADNGMCKHCVALLFATNDFCMRHKDRGTEVGTDVECVWDKPRKESAPMEIDEIDIRVDTSIPLKKTPCSKNYTAVKNVEVDSVKSEMKKVCKGTKSLILQTLYDDNDSDNSEAEYIPTVVEIAKSHSNDVLSGLKKVFDKSTIDKVEEQTRGQSDNSEWFIHKEGRITASVFSSVLHFKFTDSKENYISKQVMGKSSFINSASINFGKQHEPIARQMYTVDYKKNHKKASVKLNGLFIDEDHPYLGASPDGLVNCKCCGEGLIEIKCSYVFQDKLPKEACSDHHYHLYLDTNENIKLKVSSPWYIQIQGQLGVCKKEFCDFIFFTKKGYIVDRIYFDKEIYDNIVSTSKKFYEKYILNALLNQNVE